jgi:hypothetical protein
MSRIFFASMLFVMTMTGFGKAESAFARESAVGPAHDDAKAQAHRQGVERSQGRTHDWPVAGIRG